jgi:hypothetical protein
MNGLNKSIPVTLDPKNPLDFHIQHSIGSITK